MCKYILKVDFILHIDCFFQTIVLIKLGKFENRLIVKTVLFERKNRCEFSIKNMCFLRFVFETMFNYNQSDMFFFLLFKTFETYLFFININNLPF